MAAPFLFLAACHGGSSTAPATLPAASSAPSSLGSASFAVSAAKGVQSLVITVAQVNGAAPLTKGTPFTMNLTASTSGCAPSTGGALSCTASVAAPVGEVMFNVVTYAGPNGTGAQVASTQADAVIVAGATCNCVAAKAAGGGSI